MSVVNTGGPAFPCESVLLPRADGTLLNRSEYESRDTGMTLRDYFAAKVLGGLVDEMRRARRSGDCLKDLETNCKEISVISYILADAMIVARSK